MGKIMVVDDESLIREWLMMCLVSSGIPENRINQAKNGEEALNLLERDIYDCIFTDITMPKLDGIELIQRIRRKDEAVKIIILTCHNDFEFARKAVKYNVSEYLLKNELSKEDIINIMARMDKNNDKEAEEREKRTGFLNKILQGKCPVPKEDIENHGILIGNSYFSVAVRNRKLDISNIKPLNLKYSETLECFYDDGSKLLFLLNFKGETYLYKQALTNLEKRIKDIFGERTVIGISRLYSEHELLGICLNEAVISWETRFFGSENIKLDHYLYNDEHGTNNYKPQIKRLAENVVTQYILSGKDCVADNIAQIYTFFKDNKIWDSEFLKRKIIDILEEIEAKADIKHGGTKAYLSRILGADSWEEIEEYINQFISGINEIKIYSDSIKNAKKYISFHYNEPITLTELAKYVGLSEEYFSRLFKKEVGKNFTEYMIELRMEKARTLLKMGTFSVNEVSEMIGITNQSYFSSQFKKFYGISPSSIKG